MPNLNGIELCRRLRKISKVPIIVLSARDAEANERRALKAGAFAYLEKPVDDEDLLETIATALK